MIADLLPEYHKFHGNNPTYEILQSMVIDGHEVAWMEFKGITGKRQYSGRMLRCECHFLKGVGWDSKDGKVHNLSGPEKCPKRAKAVSRRRIELRKEYLKRFGVGKNNLSALRKNIPEIITDLKEKVRAGEFLEDGNGASFWGGYFYLQTLAAIIDPSMNYWEIGDHLVKNKLASLEGAVVRDYHKPPPAAWEEFMRCEHEGYIGIASLPAHSEMPRAWKLDVLAPGGKPAYKKPTALPLAYAPTFGPDVSDVENAKKKLDELIRNAIKKAKRR